MSAADVFYSDFGGTFTLFASANSLGLEDTDNLDALDVEPTAVRDADCNSFIPVDQLDVVGPVPNEVPIGVEQSVTATVLMDFAPVPDTRVVFTKIQGGFSFTGCGASPDGTRGVLMTDENGTVSVTFVEDCAGPGLIEVTVPGSTLSPAYSFFQVVPPANDDCSNAAPVEDGLPSSFCTVDTTTDGPDEPGLCDFDGDGDIDLTDYGRL